MPTYEFRCETCEERQFITAGIKEELNPRCTRCDKKLLKVFSSPPIRFLGTGWASKDKK
jgi:putative FmdB family regulatory protein